MNLGTMGFSRSVQIVAIEPYINKFQNLIFWRALCGLVVKYATYETLRSAIDPKPRLGLNFTSAGVDDICRLAAFLWVLSRHW